MKTVDSGFNKQEFLSLVINQLATVDGLKEVFYEKMLLGLHDNEPILTSDENAEGASAPSDVLKNIFDNIDWDMLNSSEYGQDKFFNDSDSGLYTSLGNELEKFFTSEGNDYRRRDLVGDASNWWTNSYWNESIAKLLQILAQRIDPNNIRAYENSGLLIELIEDADHPDVDGKIDTTHLRAGISAKGATAELRIIDIIDADAGNSFAGEVDTYEYGDYYDTVKFTYYTKKLNEETQEEEDVPHVTKLTTVLFKQKADTILSKIRNEQMITDEEFVSLISKGNEGMIFSGVIDAHTGDLPSEVLISMETEGEYFRFKITKNPWVIPWYNFDGESYRRVRGSDKRVSALTDKNKLDFTRKKKSEKNRWIRLLMPRYKRKVEVEDLNRNFWVIGQVLAGISADIFDEDGPIGSILKGLLKEIAELWENVVYLWAALALLSQKRFYGKTHSEVVTLPIDQLYPYLKYDNFDIYSLNDIDSKISAQLDYLLQMYPEQNLCILPQVRMVNYERNYYDTIWFPGVFVYNRNNDPAAWEVYHFNDVQDLKVTLSNYNDYIYGLLEEEDSYLYVAPLSEAAKINGGEDKRFYGLVRDKIDFSGNLYDYNEETSEWVENPAISLDLDFVDLARKLVAAPRSTYEEIQDFKEFRDTHAAELAEYDIDYITDVIWGNVNMDDRQILMVDGYQQTVLGGSMCFDYGDKFITICFSHLVQRPDMDTPLELGDDVIRNYFQGIIDTIDEDVEDVGEYIRQADAEEGAYGIFAMAEVIETPEEEENAMTRKLGEFLHYIGKYGAILLWQDEIEEIADSIGVSLEALLQMNEATFCDLYQDNTSIFTAHAELDNNAMELEITYDALEDGEVLEKIDETRVPIEKGFYQGELLSTCIDALRRELNVTVLSPADLTPVFCSESDLVNGYPTPAFAELRAQDSTILRALLTLSFEYNLDGEDAFWSNHNANNIFTVQQNYFGEYNQDKTDFGGKKTRANAPWSRYDYTNNPSNYKKYYEEAADEDETSIHKWKTLMADRLTSKETGEKIDENTVLFVEGRRDYSYGNDGGAISQKDVNSYQYLPYDSNGEYQGFIAPMFNVYRGRGMTKTGSALLFKIQDKYAYGFYSKHVEITHFNSDQEHPSWKGIPDTSNPFIAGKSSPQGYTWAVRRESDNVEENIPVSTIIANDTDIKRIITTTGAGGLTDKQYLIMRKSDEQIFTETNWRVCQIESNYVEPYLLYNKNGVKTLTNMHKYYRSVGYGIDIVYEGLLRKYAEMMYNDGYTGIATLAQKVKEYLCSVGTQDNLAGIQKDTYYSSASAQEKQNIDNLVAFMNNKYLNQKYAEDEADYFQYQVVLAAKYPVIYEQICYIYNHLNPNNQFEIECNTIYEEFKDESMPVYSSCGIPDPEGNLFTSRVFLTGAISKDIGVYVYGPEISGTDCLYARRAYLRAYDENDSSPKYVKQVEEITEYGTVDDLRENFIVVATTNKKINLEKYKTKLTGKQVSAYYNNVYPHFPDDNSVYKVVWDPDIVEYEPEE